MKPNPLFAAVLAAAMLVAGTVSGAQLKIITHNIRDAFSPRPSRTQSYRSEAANHRDFVAFMKKRAPDIVCLQELCNGQGERFTAAKLAAMAKEYGHNYSAIVDSSYGVGITSKYPMKVVFKGSPKGFSVRGIIHAEICGLNILCTHLDASGPVPRLREAHILLDYLRGKKLNRCLLMGDLNGRSPFDGDLYPDRPLRSVDYKTPPFSLLKENVDYSVISTFLSYPLIDTMRIFVPNARDRMTWPNHWYSERYGHKFPDVVGERLDYIFATPDLIPTLRKGFIWNHACEPAEQYKEENAIRDASDHAPNELILEIPDADLK